MVLLDQELSVVVLVGQGMSVVVLVGLRNECCASLQIRD